MPSPTFQIGKPLIAPEQEPSGSLADHASGGSGTVPPFTSAGLSWAYDESHIVPTAGGFSQRAEPIGPLHFAGARYLGELDDKSRRCSGIVVQTGGGTFLLEKREQNRNHDDPMALRQPFGITAQRIDLTNPSDLKTYRMVAGFEVRFLTNEELRELDPLVKGKSDKAFYFQRITGDAIVAEQRRLDKLAEQGT